MYIRTALAVSAACLMAACSTTPTAKLYDQSALPTAVQAPAGNKVVLETVGAGLITYECKASAVGAATPFAWVFVGPDAKLNDRSGKQVGKYYGPPATWEANDGSKFTGTQVAVAPNVAGAIPLQLVKANPAIGEGAMKGVSFVQRVATVGGLAPAAVCDAAGVGRKQTVGYQADYIFYAAQ